MALRIPNSEVLAELEENRRLITILHNRVAELESRCAVLEAENGYRRTEARSTAGWMSMLQHAIGNDGRLPYDYAQRLAEMEQTARSERAEIDARFGEIPHA